MKNKNVKKKIKREKKWTVDIFWFFFKETWACGSILFHLGPPIKDVEIRVTDEVKEMGQNFSKTLICLSLGLRVF